MIEFFTMQGRGKSITMQKSPSSGDRVVLNNDEI